MIVGHRRYHGVAFLVTTVIMTRIFFISRGLALAGKILVLVEVSCRGNDARKFHSSL